MVTEYTSMYLIFMLSSNKSFSTLTSNFTSGYESSFPKCCLDHHSFSVVQGKCISTEFSTKSLDYEDSTTHIESSIPEISCGYSFADYASFPPDIPVAKFEQFFHNESLNVDIENEFHRFERHTYCLAEDRSLTAPILLVCKAKHSPGSELQDDSDFLLMISAVILLILSAISLSLIVITFGIYLALPELRKKVKDKCFICYLATFILIMLSFYVNVFLPNLFKPYDWCLLSFTWMMHLSWLNAMCIHLWRVVTNINSISPRSFYAYVLYTMGLPVICHLLYFVDEHFSGESFSRRAKEDIVFLKPKYLYLLNVMAVQQCCNIFIFLRVGYIIWNQKQQWNRNRGSVGTISSSQSNKWFSQLLKLFIITGLDWSLTLGFAYIRHLKTVFQYVPVIINMCPGFAIFIIYVCYSKHTIFALKKRFSKIKNSMYEFPIREK